MANKQPIRVSFFLLKWQLTSANLYNDLNFHPITTGSEIKTTVKWKEKYLSGTFHQIQMSNVQVFFVNKLRINIWIRNYSTTREIQTCLLNNFAQKRSCRQRFFLWRLLVTGSSNTKRKKQKHMWHWETSNSEVPLSTQ